MKKSLIYLFAGTIAGIAMTLIAASQLHFPDMDEDGYDDFFTLDGCK